MLFAVNSHSYFTVIRFKLSGTLANMLHELQVLRKAKRRILLDLFLWVGEGCRRCGFGRHYATWSDNYLRFAHSES